MRGFLFCLALVPELPGLLRLVWRATIWGHRDPSDIPGFQQDFWTIFSRAYLRAFPDGQKELAIMTKHQQQ